MAVSQGRRRRQSGSVVVIVAGAMVALLTMTAVIFAVGGGYWTRRHLQELADTAALSGSLSITTVCNVATATAVASAAQSVLASQLPGGSGVLTTSGNCLAVGNFTYPGNVSSTITYPYNGDLTKVEVRVQQVTPFQLGAFLGQSQATIQARAVARFLGGVPSYAFAVFASNVIDCNGSTTVTVHGSVYAVNGITGGGGCSLVTKAVKDPGNAYYADFGNMLVWADGQSWACGLACADGYQLSGHTASVCGSIGTQFLDAGQTTYNPNPCPGGLTPRLDYPRYYDPNTSAPNPAAGLYQPTGQVGCDPPATLGAGFAVFVPGCYTTLDVSDPVKTLGTGKAQLSPGFYYFGANGGQGLCLNGTGQVFGSDVTLEFVGNSSMTTRSCDLASGDCAASCGFGNSPAVALSAPPTSLLGVSLWCSGICPSRGLLVYYQNQSGTGTGQFLLNGAGNSSWLKGSVFWQNASCTWAANGTSAVTGQTVCKDVHLGGNTLSSAGPMLDLTVSNLGVPEAALIE